MNDAQEVAALLNERPDLEGPLRQVAAVDAAEESWTFEDLDIDSGRFGELVSRGVVTKTERGYQVVDRSAVEQALDGDSGAQNPAGGQLDGALGGARGLSLRPESFSVSGLTRNDRRAYLAVVGVLLVLALLRTAFSAGSVFQDGAIVLSLNDPYYYRYWVEQLLANPDLTLSSLPGAVSKGEPLYIAAMWAIAALLGGGQAATGWLLAWFPVVSAVISGLFTYWIAVEVTGDRRVGLAAVLMLAIVAGHALRTSLGFADHHAFDYPWLGITGLSLVVLARVERWSPPRLGLGTIGLAVGVAGQVLAWEAGPLLIVPIGVAVAGLGILWVHTDRSPLISGAPVLAGLSLAAGVAWLVHTELTWHTDVVASAPALLLAGSLGVLVVSEAVYRLHRDSRLALGAVGLAGVGSLAGVAVGFPETWATLRTRVEGSLLRSDAIAEVQGLFGDSVGWLFLVGFVLFLGLPYLLWGSRRTFDEPVWIIPAAYTWVFFGLSALQVRFVGEFAAFIAIFAGLGFVHLAERIDVARRPKPFAGDVDGNRITLPNRQQASALFALFLLVGGLGLIQVPIKTNQTTIPPEMYETAAWIDTHSEGPSWDRPTYVFSEWSYNRMYNYFVNGEARSYGFARGNYVPFLNASDETAWYERLRGRAGFIVYDTSRFRARGGTMAARLEAYGSRTQNASGLAHYRAVYVSDEERYRVFTLVPGATLTGRAEANATVELTTRHNIGTRSITYERQVDADSNGTYSVTVPYPGQYTVAGTEVAVPESAVLNGTAVPIVDTDTSEGGEATVRRPISLLENEATP